MIILGLTGSMAMGKSTVTRMLRLIYRVPVWDADQVVRDLFITDRKLINEIAKRYPEIMVEGKIDRAVLRARAFEDEDCLTTLEYLIHSRAFSKGLQFLGKMRRLGVPICAWDAPLLFETGWNEACTHTIVVYAPSFVQFQRLQRRPDLSKAKIERILSRQWSVQEKRAYATYEIQSGLSKAYTFRQLNRIILDLKGHA